MLRSDLVEKLEIVSPALSTNPLIPAMTHFWFTGEYLQAYNDYIMIEVPLKTNFAACVPPTLLHLLKASRAQDVVLTLKGDTLNVKAASSNMKLQTLSAKEQDRKMPAPKEQGHMSVNRHKFAECIAACLRSVSIDTSVADQLGITVIGDGDELLFFSTNFTTLSHASMTLPKATKFERAILSSAFCKELLNLMPTKGDALALEIQSAYALFEGKGGTRLWGRLIASKKPLNYDEMFNSYYPKGSEKKLISIPTKLELILDRACIVASANSKAAHMEIVVEDNVAYFSTEAENGHVEDSVKLEKAHAAVELRVDPKLVKIGYGAFTQMLFTNRCMVMHDKGIYYMVSTSEG